MSVEALRNALLGVAVICQSLIVHVAIKCGTNCKYAQTCSHLSNEVQAATCEVLNNCTRKSKRCVVSSVHVYLADRRESRESNYEPLHR